MDKMSLLEPKSLKGNIVRFGFKSRLSRHLTAVFFGEPQFFCRATACEGLCYAISAPSRYVTFGDPVPLASEPGFVDSFETSLDRLQFARDFRRRIAALSPFVHSSEGDLDRAS